MNSKNDFSDHFGGKTGRNVSHLRGEIAQKLFEYLDDPEKKSPVYLVQVGKYVQQLLSEHKLHAAFEDEYTRQKIMDAVRNVENRKWAKSKQIQLEEDFMHDYYKMFVVIQRIVIECAMLSSKPEHPLLKEPEEYAYARKEYFGWMDRIFAGVDLEKQEKSIQDTAPDNSPFPLHGK